MLIRTLAALFAVAFSTDVRCTKVAKSRGIRFSA